MVVSDAHAVTALHQGQSYRGRGADDQVHLVLGADLRLEVPCRAMCGRAVFHVYTHEVATTCTACSLAQPLMQAWATYEPCG